jgi:hypothetical protein
MSRVAGLLLRLLGSVVAAGVLVGLYLCLVVVIVVWVTST